MRRLGKIEYANSVKAAFGLEEIDLGLLPDEDPGRSTPPSASALEVRAYHQIANMVSDAAALEAERECRGKAEACWEDRVRGWGRRLFRRELGDRDMSEVGEVCRAGRRHAGVAAGLKNAALLMLQAPEFLYATERGAPGDAATDVRELADDELAARLALALWLGPPDDRLLEAASRGELATGKGLRREVKRMLRHRKAAAMVAHRLTNWLVPELITATTAGEQSGAGTAEREAAMLQQLEVFASRVFRKGGGLRAFVSHPSSPVNALLSDIYGLDVGRNDKMEWKKTQRRYGLLTLPAFLAAKSTPGHTSIVTRGLFVSEQLLCRSVSPPPQGVDTTIPPPVPGETTRERYERHATDPTCASCHRRMDPLGFAFENYDKSGRYRELDQGAQIDASGSLAIDGVLHEFDGVAELSSILSRSDRARACWTHQWVTWMLPAEPPRSVEALAEDVAGSTANKTSLSGVLRAVVTSERFRRVASPRAWAEREVAEVPGKVRALVDARCGPCHLSGGDAVEDADFSGDDELRERALMIMDRTEADEMPPDDPLPDAERAVLREWVRDRG